MNKKPAPEGRGDFRHILIFSSPHPMCTRPIPSNLILAFSPQWPCQNTFFLPAFQIPFSIKGCSCNAAGQIQSLLKNIHFGWWSLRNLSTMWSAVLKVKQIKAKSSLEMWCCWPSPCSQWSPPIKLLLILVEDHYSIKYEINSMNFISEFSQSLDLSNLLITTRKFSLSSCLPKVTISHE